MRPSSEQVGKALSILTTPGAGWSGAGLAQAASSSALLSRARTPGWRKYERSMVFLPEAFCSHYGGPGVPPTFRSEGSGEQFGAQVAVATVTDDEHDGPGFKRPAQPQRRGERASA